MDTGKSVGNRLGTGQKRWESLGKGEKRLLRRPLASPHGEPQSSTTEPMCHPNRVPKGCPGVVFPAPGIAPGQPMGLMEPYRGTLQRDPNPRHPGAGHGGT